MSTWRRLPFDLGGSARHFALSDALVRHSPEPSLWWHSTAIPTLILGAAQRSEDIDLERVRSQGVAVVRRHAGGTAVLARPGVLGLDIVLPAGEPPATPDIVEAYRWLGDTWQATLARLGAETHVLSVREAREGNTPGPYDAIVRLACFGSLSPYEVVVSGRRKLVGLAQVRRSSRALFQAGIHTHFDADHLSALLAGTQQSKVADALRGGAVGLDEILTPPPNLDTVMETFEGTLQDRLGVRLQNGPWTETELTHAANVEGSVSCEDSSRPED